MQLRPHQVDICDQIMAAGTNDLIQLDTGAGKTAILAALAARAPCFIAVAHRNILITQISATLASFNVRHGVIATKHTRRRCEIAHRKMQKQALDVDHSTRFVASVDSILARHRRGALGVFGDLPYWIFIDEAHHCVSENKWGLLQKIFPNARIIGLTATPTRLDGQSLHIDKGGVFHRLVQCDGLKNDSVRTLIQQGYLTDFKVYAFESALDTQHLVMRGADYTVASLEQALERNKYYILGHAITEYRRHAPGRQAVAMCISIKNAEETAQEFRAAGIPAACISSKMSAVDVSRVIDLFQRKHINVLCNVDMLGEGLDIPGIEVVILLRKTASLVSHRQWIGRALRPAPDKAHAIIIDHVGNVATHGAPDEPITWDLLRPPITAARTNLLPCTKCRFVYRAWLASCPECSTENPLMNRRSIGGHYVDTTVIDVELCERKRRAIIQEDRLTREIIWLPMPFDNNAVGQLCARLLKWFVASIESEVDIKSINAFIQSPSARSSQFWVDHFTIRDLQKQNPAKCLKVFKKWLLR